MKQFSIICDIICEEIHGRIVEIMHARFTERILLETSERTHAKFNDLQQIRLENSRGFQNESLEELRNKY